MTFVFDSVFSWTVMIPFALALVRFTNLDIMVLYPLCQGIEVVKCILGLALVRNGIWIRNIVTV